MTLRAAVTTALIALAASQTQVQAATLTIEVVNTTRGLHFTPLLVTAHPAGTRLFAVGEPASSSLATMAEGGDITSLQADLAGLNASVSADAAGGLLAPGAKATLTLIGGQGTPNRLLSVAAMILPSNDGFIGLNAVPIPEAPGTYVFELPVYDAGSEANDELVGSGAPGQAGFPVPPPLAPMTDSGGAGVAVAAEGFVHVHRGSLGDSNQAGGVSDIDSRRHRWLNPAARVIVTVN